jgi:hypothetical protein
MMILAAMAFYTLAHLLRAFRFWLLLQDPNLSLKKTFVIFQGTSALGGVIPLLVVEIARWVALTYVAGRKQMVAVVSMNLFARLLDVLVAAVPLLVNTLFIYKGPQADPNGVFLFSLLAIGLGLVCTAPQALTFIKQVTIARGRSAMSVSIVRWMILAERGFFRFLDQPLSSLVFQVLLTALIWSLDILAFDQVSPLFRLPIGNKWDVASLWSAHSFGRLFGMGADPLAPPALWSTLIMPQLILTAVLLLWLGICRLTRKAR